LCKNENGSNREPGGDASAMDSDPQTPPNAEAERMRAALRSLKMRKSCLEKSKTSSPAAQPSRLRSLPGESSASETGSPASTDSPVRLTKEQTKLRSQSSQDSESSRNNSTPRRHSTGSGASASSSPNARLDEPQPSSEPVLRANASGQSSVTTSGKDQNADAKAPRGLPKPEPESVTPGASTVNQRRARLACLSTKLKQTPPIKHNPPQDQNKSASKTPTSTAKVDKTEAQDASSVRSSFTNLSSFLNQEADESWLLQRQVEVELSLRTKMCSNEDIVRLTSSFKTIVRFFDELRSISDSLNIPSGVIFQEVLSRLSECSADFDGQGGIGDIPMHQAKVLDRRPSLQQFGNIEELVGAEKMEEFLQPVQELRTLLRVKVEDANDLCMAEEAAKTAAHFLTGLSRYADQKAQSQLQALEALRAF